MRALFKILGIEYGATRPSIGLQSQPELLTCCHEESAIAMVHGYAKIEGKPMLAMLHGADGLKRAAMAIYNAYADRAPIYVVVVQSPAETEISSTVREFTKWIGDSNSATLTYEAAMTPPMGPALLVLNQQMLESVRPSLPKVHPPQGDRESVREAARRLVNAQRPLILAQRAARTSQGMDLLVELAELLQAPVHSSERVNFPNQHPLAGSGGVAYQSDVVLGLEVRDIAHMARRAKFINVSSVSLHPERNFQTQGGYAGDVDIDIGADAQATLPSLIEECRRIMTGDHRNIAQQRGQAIADAHKRERDEQMRVARQGWDDSPISLNRLCGELWTLIQDEDWSLVSWDAFIGRRPSRLWNFDRHYRYIGGQGAGGLGYGAPAAVGAALANRKYGRLSVNIQTDGDLLYGPGALWTAAQHRIPLLTIMHNNRAYYTELKPLQMRAKYSNRDPGRAPIGISLRDPDINYAEMARSMGLYAEGPISDPGELRVALQRGIARVKSGEPVLIDVLTQPR